MIEEAPGRCTCSVMSGRVLTTRTPSPQSPRSAFLIARSFYPGHDCLFGVTHLVPHPWLPLCLSLKGEQTLVSPALSFLTPSRGPALMGDSHPQCPPLWSAQPGAAETPLVSTELFRGSGLIRNGNQSFHCPPIPQTLQYLTPRKS